VYVSIGYNLAVKHCTKPFFVFLHDDTYVAPDFLENITKHITPNSFFNFVQVEPPMFGNVDMIQRPIRSFGLSAEEFDVDSFREFYWSHVAKLPHTTEPSLYGGFFMAGCVDSFNKVGGFDESFQPYFFEDSDLMIRMHQAGYRFTMILDAIVYHIPSMTSRNSADSAQAHSTTQKIFLKKWKTTFDCYKDFSMLHGSQYCYPSVNIQMQNCNDSLREYVELFSDPAGINTLKVDGAKLTQQDLDLLTQIPYIIESTDSNSTYELGNLILITQ